MLSSLLDAEDLIKSLLFTIAGLPAAKKLSSHSGSSRKSLSEDVASLYAQFPEQVNTKALATLLGYIIEHPDDQELIWDQVYRIFTPSTPQPDPDSSLELSIASLGDSRYFAFQKHWVHPYLEDSLIALQDLVRRYNGTVKISDYYARTIVFVQSSGVGNSRLADAFGQSCPMINFVFVKGQMAFLPVTLRCCSSCAPSRNKSTKEMRCCHLLH
jgi:hypothetical protein